MKIENKLNKEAHKAAEAIHLMVNHLAEKGRFGTLSRIDSLMINMMKIAGEFESYAERVVDLSNESFKGEKE